MRGKTNMTKSAPDDLKIADLEARSGISKRTIRLYISRGLLPGPVKSGRDATYSRNHLERLLRIKKLQREGLTLHEIGHELSSHQERSTLPHPTSYWSYPVAEDVLVMVRAGATPWRNKHIRKALARMAAELDGRKEGGNDESDS
jgi:DNA-binding transcriptional MerR regulator